MVSKLAAGIVAVIVVVGIGVAAYLLTRQYTLTISVSPSGSGSVSPSSGTFKAGTSLTLTATPASGYLFDHWEIDNSGENTSVTITIIMNSDKDVTAYFAPTTD